MIRRRQAVDADLVDQAEYIFQRSPDAALRFLEATEATFTALEAAPRMAPQWSAAPSGMGETRFWPVRGFPNHLIFFRLIPDGIEILRVLHGRRNLESLLADDA